MMRQKANLNMDTQVKSDGMHLSQTEKSLQILIMCHSLVYFAFLWPVWGGNFIFLKKSFKNLICCKSLFAFISFSGLPFPWPLLPTASSYLHLSRSHHQPPCDAIVSKKAREKYKLRLGFEFLYKLRTFLVKVHSLWCKPTERVSHFAAVLFLLLAKWNLFRG